MASLKLDSFRLDQADQQSTDTDVSPTANPASIDIFDAALHKKNNDNSRQNDQSQQDQSSSEKDKKHTEQAIPTVSDLLGSLFGKAMEGTAIESPAAQVNTDMGTLVDSLVNRILVSQPGHGQEEVRLLLNDGTLRDTEIHISKSTDGNLNLSLLSSDPSSLRLLAEAQPALLKQLEQYGHIDITIKNTAETSDQSQGRHTLSSTSQNAGDNNTDKRSQGYTAYDPDSIK